MVCARFRPTRSKQALISQMLLQVYIPPLLTMSLGQMRLKGFLSIFQYSRWNCWYYEEEWKTSCLSMTISCWLRLMRRKWLPKQGCPIRDSFIYPLQNFSICSCDQDEPIPNKQYFKNHTIKALLYHIKHPSKTHDFLILLLMILLFVLQSVSISKVGAMFAKKKLKRQDFLFQNGWFEDKIKKPGELQMQQFQISDCEECNIYLLDAAACVYVDECQYCNIFIAASESSIFIRDCKFLTVFCTTQQFRVRDCSHCHFSIFCESQPIIESSHDITFSCFPSFSYEGLDSQMKQAKTNPWNNNWFDVYDFTPRKFNTVNYALKPLSEEREKAFLNNLRLKMREINLKQCKSIIPRVLGKQSFTPQDIYVLVVYPTISTRIHNNVPLIQCREHRVNEEEQAGLHLDIPTEQKRISILFLKIERKLLPKWRSLIPQIHKQIGDQKQLQLYQNTVFAPFKDQH